jgi:tetratricopeptide (TPR) repeat protein
MLAAAMVLMLAALPRATRLAGLAAGAAVIVGIALSPRWDRELLASGVYLYAPFAPKDASLEALLKAGQLLYYREGAAATVSVKRLTGTTTLAVDGKTDASNRGDMLTQKLVAHLPLLLHDNPREMAVVGLGSGVTVGAALTHPVARVDVIEISPEVVDASHLFAEENRRALADPRTHLLIGDGRSHLQLSRRKYDVIVSEPSNPWIAGVAALFTREFFLAARERLAPGGLICQWANAYNISDRDLRAIVATFRSVFPDGTAWLVGADDVVLLASDAPLDDRLASIERHWQRPGVADDLAMVAAVEPFSLWSLFVAGPAELERYGQGAGVLTDDRMSLEFSAPKELHGRSAGENGATLKALRRGNEGPEVIRRANASADSRAWTRRGQMMARRDAHSAALADFQRALEIDMGNGEALDGLVRAAVLTRKSAEALGRLESLTSGTAPSTRFLVARSKLLAASDQGEGAREAAVQAAARADGKEDALSQLASLQADAADIQALGVTVARLREAAPDAAATAYFRAVLAFLQGNAQEALGLAQRALSVSPGYAAAYDLIGAAHTKLGQVDQARNAFFASLRFDAHDSTAYTNLGILELNAGNRAAAADLFAEALWLDENSTLAREGLARAK